MTTHQQTGSIQFLMGDSTEVLRISKDGITANPDVPVDEIAQTVLEALAENIRVLVQRSVEAEREACAQVCENMSLEWQNQPNIAQAELATIMDCALAIRTRGEKRWVKSYAGGKPNYTTPEEQTRQWQGLTEAEKVNVAIDCGCADVAWMDFADAIEAKLKEKNT